MNKPKPLVEGATIGVVSPAGGMPREMFDGCIDTVRTLGFEPVIAPHAWIKETFYAAPAEDRAADLVAMFSDPSIDAIWCSQGGFGAERLFPYMDFDVIKQHPKLLIGDSNIDQLHYMIHRHATPYTLGWKNLSALATWNGSEHEWTSAVDTFKRIVMGAEVPWSYPLVDRDPAVKTLVEGRVEAPITGGCEMGFAMGTPWEPSFDGKIVVLDVSVSDTFWNKWLAQLNSAGLLKTAAGFIIIAQTAIDPIPPRLNVDTHSTERWPHLRDYLDEFITPLGKPTLLNVPMSHSRGGLPIPHGARVELDATNKQLTLVEPFVD
ncbi:MAG: LD-carboxypeptidase [Pseudomonadota bacterium]